MLTAHRPVASSPHRLCDRCLVEPWGEQIWRDFHTQKRTFTGETLQQIYYERAKGEPLLDMTGACAWCVFLGLNLKTTDKEYNLRQCLSSMPNASATFRIKFPDVSHAKPNRFTVAFLSVMVSWDNRMLDFYATFGVIARPGGPASATFIAPDTFTGVEPADGSFNIDLATSWLNDCADNHDTCKQISPPRLPRRVLDVFSNAPLVSLQELDEGAAGHYACLSYTWGSSLDLPEVFTRAARSMFAAPVEVDTLPRTFQDAIKVARGLRLRYLWIDGLCIWQDEPDDKARHIPRMHEYFGNATIMIQPPGVASVDEAFLGSSRVPEVARRLAAWDLQGSTRGPGATTLRDLQAVEQSRQHPSGAPFHEFPYFSQDGERDEILFYAFDGLEPYSAKSEPASQRGWILQEELLCRRALIFPSTGGIIFRCKADAAETHDCNTIFNSSHHFEPLIHKKVVLKQEEKEMGLDLFKPQLRINVDRARRLARANPERKPYVSWMDGAILLRLGNDPEDKIKALEDGYSAAPIWVDKPDGSRDICPYSARLYSKSLADDPQADAECSKVVYSTPPPDRITASAAMTAWRSIVNDYSRRKLTNPDDKLPAIAALAREFYARYAPITGGYAAGLWGGHVEDLLGWWVLHSEDGRPPLAKPTPTRAPSWSWAAVEGGRYGDQTEMTEEEDALAFKTTEVEMTDLTIHAMDAERMYESVVGGELKLKCAVMRTILTGTDEPTAPAIVEFGSKEPLTGSRVYLDCAEAVFPKNGVLGVYFVLLHRSTIGIGNPRDKWEGMLVMKMPDDSRYAGKHMRLGYLVWWEKRDTLKTMWMERLLPAELVII